MREVRANIYIPHICRCMKILLFLLFIAIRVQILSDMIFLFHFCDMKNVACIRYFPSICRHRNSVDDSRTFSSILILIQCKPNWKGGSKIKNMLENMSTSNEEIRSARTATVTNSQLWLTLIAAGRLNNFVNYYQKFNSFSSLRIKNSIEFFSYCMIPFVWSLLLFICGCPSSGHGMPLLTKVWISFNTKRQRNIREQQIFCMAKRKKINK